MSHEFESGLFVGQPAWHGLGTVLEAPPSVEEAITLAGLDWRVKLCPLFAKDDPAVTPSVPVEHFAAMRDSDSSILGVVGPAFVPLQNKDAFQWFQPLVESGAFTIEAAGSLRQGKRVWILAKAPGMSGDVIPGDEVSQYLLLAHGHDGTLSIRCGYTAVRVVCQNTLTAAVDSDQSKLVRIAHRASAQVALEGVRGLILAGQTQFQELMGKLTELAKHNCTTGTLHALVREVFAPGGTQDDVPRIVSRCEELFESGRGTDHPGVRGTLWGAYNAITEYLTHEQGRTPDSRVESAWFGKAGENARRALEVSLRFAAMS